MNHSKFRFAILLGGFCFLVFSLAGSALLNPVLQSRALGVGGATIIYLPAIFRANKTVTERISVSEDGAQGNGLSHEPSISADGRFIAFTSDASNLVDGDVNNVADIFVHDRKTGEMTIVSVASNGARANGSSYGGASISPDGRFVTFVSTATNLVDTDTNNMQDIFVHDMETGETTLVSVSSNGDQSNDESQYPVISEDGRYVVYESMADNLVADDTNNFWDIFIHDRQTQETKRLSVANDGSQANGVSQGASMSANGRFITFISGADNLVGDDTNMASDVFIYDRELDEIGRLPVSNNGAQANAHAYCSKISRNGRFVTFCSFATNLTENDTNGYGDIFVHDRQTGETANISLASDGEQANWDSLSGNISDDGRFVVFASYADNLVDGDTNESQDIFLHDRHLGSTIRVSVPNNHFQASKHNYFPVISADGTIIAFDSVAWNLVEDDTNGFVDVYIRVLGLE